MVITTILAYVFVGGPVAVFLTTTAQPSTSDRVREWALGVRWTRAVEPGAEVVAQPDAAYYEEVVRREQLRTLCALAESAHATGHELLVEVENVVAEDHRPGPGQPQVVGGVPCRTCIR